MARKKIEFDLDLVKFYASRGLNFNQISKMLGVSPHTVLRRKKDSDSFANAIAAGRAESLVEIGNSLYDSAKNGNVQAQQFFLKNVGEDGQWADKDQSLKVELNLRDVLADAKGRLNADNMQTKNIIEGESLDITGIDNNEQLPIKKLNNK